MGIVGATLVVAQNKEGAQNNDKATTRVAPTVGDIILIKILLVFFLSFGISLFNGFNVGAAFAQDLLQVPAAIQISSTVSDGKHTIEEITKIAKENGAKIVIFADRDYMRWEYGLWPLRNIIKRLVKSNSLAAYGIQKYLKEIEDAQRENPDLILIPGVECAPFYYWEGSPFENNLKIKNWHKHMMVVGLEKIEDYQNIPSVVNKNSLRLRTSLKDLFRLWPLLGVGGGVWCLRKRKFNYRNLQGQNLGPYSSGWRILGICAMLLSLLFLTNNFPFYRYFFDQYHGDAGIKPYQNLIDYCVKKNGLIFWVHPEAEYIQTRGNIAIETKEYSQDLLKSRNYDGFTIFYDGYNKIGSPAGIWDELLKDYCQGKRVRPVWAIGGLGFDQAGALAAEIKNLRTIFLLPALSKKAVVEALKKGKSYTVMGKDVLRLESFFLEDSLSDTQKAAMGDELMLKGNPVLRIRGYIISDKDEVMKIKLIRNGEVIKVFEVQSPFNITYEDSAIAKNEMGYYRLEAVSQNSILVTNPVFVKFSSENPPISFFQIPLIPPFAKEDERGILQRGMKRDFHSHCTLTLVLCNNNSC